MSNSTGTNTPPALGAADADPAVLAPCRPFSSGLRRPSARSSEATAKEALRGPKIFPTFEFYSQGQMLSVCGVPGVPGVGFGCGVVYANPKEPVLEGGRRISQRALGGNVNVCCFATSRPRTEEVLLRNLELNLATPPPRCRFVFQAKDWLGK